MYLLQYYDIIACGAASRQEEMKFHVKGESQARISAEPGRHSVGVVHGGQRPDRVDAGPGGHRRHPVATAIMARSLDRPERVDADNSVPAAR